ncbi:GMC family oxidoreductase [Deinococcus sp.]|uniref:GMC family oxidoreductase n=1 Tax=Deinococcus sp. TaxID=47478 RepID=UPI003CC5D029
MPDPLASPVLRALVERIIPADDPPADWPSGWQTGVGTFLEGIFERELSGNVSLFGAGLDGVEREARARHGTAFTELNSAAQDALISDLLVGKTRADWPEIAAAEFLAWLIRLCMQGYYGDPGNGGNRGGAAWSMIGYRPVPPGTRWPPVQQAPPPLTDWDAAQEHYDAVIVGAGAGGGVAACVLAEAGVRVLLVERGPWQGVGDLPADHLRSQRLSLGYQMLAGPPLEGNPRVYVGEGGAVTLSPSDARWSNNAVTVGGGTRVYGAQAWRFCPEDFRMASRYGVPQGSSLADWPISYDELEADYQRAEWELGVSGDPAGNVCAGPRRRGYPMPPLPPNGTVAVLRKGAESLGLHTSPVPLLINSEPYHGRGACLGCGACVGFGCPGEFKNDTRNTVIARALASGRCDLLTGVQAERVVTDEAGRVRGVALVTRRGGEIVRREVWADQVLLGAGAIETARLLLNSPSRRDPNGLGNNLDQVGRNLQGHVYAGAFAVFDEPVQDCLGPGPSIATNDYRHGNAGMVGGAMLANDFVPMPLWVYGMLSTLDPGFPTWGLESKRRMREVYPRLALVFGPVQELPNPESRVTLDQAVRDGFGMPAARLSGDLHPQDRQTAQFISERAAAWVRASGAKTVVPLVLAPAEGPSGGQHQAGTCRMGLDPASSVTDAWGQVWGHDNLHLVDGSLHVTNGGVNPVLTILALAYRVSRHLAERMNA